MMSQHDILMAAKLVSKMSGGGANIVSVTQSQFDNMPHIPDTVYIIFPDEDAPSAQAMAMAAPMALMAKHEDSADIDEFPPDEDTADTEVTEDVYSS